VDDIAEMVEVFRQCGGDNADDDTQEGCARLEVRVPLRRANQVLLDLPENVVQESCTSFDTVVWWCVSDIAYRHALTII